MAGQYPLQTSAGHFFVEGPSESQTALSHPQPFSESGATDELQSVLQRSRHEPKNKLDPKTDCPNVISSCCSDRKE
jgi:hypothetical protein